MFDPIIRINLHIGLLHARDALAEEMSKHRGITRSVIQGVGRMVMDELRRSKEIMRDNKMWIAETPLIEGRYRYAYMGKTSMHDIDAETLEFYKLRAMDGVEKRLEDLLAASQGRG